MTHRNDRYCGWNRALGECRPGLQTTDDEVNERLGDCGKVFAPGRGNSCSSASNAVCEEAQSERVLDASATVEPVCDEGTDCSDCGNCEIPLLIQNPSNQSSTGGQQQQPGPSDSSAEQTTGSQDAEESPKTSGGTTALAVILVLLFLGVVAAFAYWQRQKEKSGETSTIGSVLQRASSMKASSSSSAVIYGDGDGSAAGGVHVQGADCVYDIPMEAVAGTGIASVTNPMYTSGSTGGMGMAAAVAAAPSKVVYAVPMDGVQGQSGPDDPAEIVYATPVGGGGGTIYSTPGSSGVYYDVTYTSSSGDNVGSSITASSV